MRVSVVLCVALFACALVLVSAKKHQQQQQPKAAVSEEDQFVDYMKLHNKNYATTEMFTRFNVFRANLKKVNEHNALYAAGKSSFTMAMNALADLTAEEYRSRLGLRHTTAEPRMASAMAPSVDASAVPESMDWTTKGAVNKVKDQGGCGSCWAFSATASMEATDFLETNKLKSFSEQMCVDCVLGGTCTCDAGGEMHDCFVYVHTMGGEMLESDYPYTEQSLGVCHYDKTKQTGKFGNYVNVTMYDEEALKVAASQMVISVGIDASSMEFQMYSGGVYDVEGCKTEWKDLDHGVTVVGYGTDAKTKKDYWLVRNSWGSSWGLNGYIWMVRNKNNQCGIATDASYIPPQAAPAHHRRRWNH